MSYILDITLRITRQLTDWMLRDFQSNYSRSRRLKHKKELKKLKKQLSRNLREKNEIPTQKRMKELMYDHVKITISETGESKTYREWLEYRKSKKSANKIKNFSRRSKYSTIKRY